MGLKIIFGWEGKRANFSHVLCQEVIQTGLMPVANPHGRPFIAPKKQILAFLWRIANQEPARAVGQIDLMMEYQMEQKISGISKVSEKRTTSRGWPEFSKQSFRNIPFHLILYRNFRKFWINGSRPWKYPKFSVPFGISSSNRSARQPAREFLVSYPPQKRQYLLFECNEWSPMWISHRHATSLDNSLAENMREVCSFPFSSENDF